MGIIDKGQSPFDIYHAMAKIAIHADGQGHGGFGT